jgi:hypothetical protein
MNEEDVVVVMVMEDSRLVLLVVRAEAERVVATDAAAAAVDRTESLFEIWINPDFSPPQSPTLLTTSNRGFQERMNTNSCGPRSWIQFLGERVVHNGSFHEPPPLQPTLCDFTHGHTQS